jgi:acyl-CoA dehydrogenase
MSIFLFLIGVLALGFFSAKLIFWLAFISLFFAFWGMPTIFFLLVGVVFLVFGLPLIRQRLITLPLMRLIKHIKLFPTISNTEREALNAGSVWFEGELFSGNPDFKRLIEVESYPELAEEEIDFLNGPVEELCRLTDDWLVFQKRDLSPRVWQFLKDKGFFGMIIPKKYGGLEFSSTAVSAVIKKLSSRSIPLGITAMLPNSLGPAELLMHYGTPEQKKKLLPRLAAGLEVPCFALTETNAGSDAGSIQSKGILFKDSDGTIKIRLNWEKRYITLASKASLIGLAFKLEDPEQLLQRGTHLGICCGLIPADTPGIIRGNQHDPLNVPFFNCPFEGRDVVVDIDVLVGGVSRIGQGWRMLMEQLAAGRGIMLPASATAGTQLAFRVVSAYGTVRKQFGLSIAKFEGIEEPMARIGGAAYILEAARRFTCGGLDGGAKPAVVSAIAKYHFTEKMREVINDAMDITGGAGISRGPRNLLAHSYFSAPISITVEGANILTRTLMIFGQGAIRCHPFAENEITALENGDVKHFDFAFFGHIRHVISNFCRSIVMNLTRGYAASVPFEGRVRRDYQKISWASSRFAILSDIAMISYGGNLKRKEMLTGRFSDVFSWLYFASAILRRYEAEGRSVEDYPFYRWSMDYALNQVQKAFEGIYSNFDVPILGPIFRYPVAWFVSANAISGPPSDAVSRKVSKLMCKPGEQRDRLTEGIFIPKIEGEALHLLDSALVAVSVADSILSSIKKLVRSGDLPHCPLPELLEKAFEKGVINESDLKSIELAKKLCSEAVKVDSFSQSEYLATAFEGGW